MSKTREEYNEYHRNYYHAHRDVMNERNKARYHKNKLDKKRNQEKEIDLENTVVDSNE